MIKLAVERNLVDLRWTTAIELPAIDLNGLWVVLVVWISIGGHSVRKLEKQEEQQQ